MKGLVTNMKISEIYEYIDSFAPFDSCEEYDNSGLLVGNPETEISRALVSLDVTKAVIDEAVRENCGLIISHHPVIFEPLRAIPSNSLPYLLCRNEIAVLSAHTNLDIAAGGVNDWLTGRIGLEDVKPFGEDGLGRIGVAGKKDLSEFLFLLRDRLNCKGMRYTRGAKDVEKVAVCCGAGGFLLDDAVKSGADTFVTADIKYSVMLEAADRGLNLIDAGHYATENGFIPEFCRKLNEKFPEIEFLLSGSNIDITELA